MVYRYAKFIGMDMDAESDYAGYTDADEIADWAEEAMSWAVGIGLIEGRSSTSLAPEGTATRAEVATLLQRVIIMMVQ